MKKQNKTKFSTKKPKADLATASLRLHKAAVSSRDKAHSPYSGHKVGAAIRLKSGEVFSGCNIENASYGGTVCAERVAIWKAVSELGQIELSEVVVVTDSQNPWPPCGLCRQIIAEFGSPQTRIHTGNLLGLQKSFLFKDLLPEAFHSDFLKK